jgi:hypothetical protein
MWLCNGVINHKWNNWNLKKKLNVDVNLAVIKVFSETREQEKDIANLRPLYSTSKKIFIQQTLLQHGVFLN